MKLLYHKNFVKAWSKLNAKMQNKVDEAIEVFVANHNNPILKNHSLSGGLSGRRAIKVTGDIRIVFEEYANYTVVMFVDVGSHNQVY
jgi:addiction module RelE/StbE family toxin